MRLESLRTEALSPISRIQTTPKRITFQSSTRTHHGILAAVKKMLKQETGVRQHSEHLRDPFGSFAMNNSQQQEQSTRHPCLSKQAAVCSSQLCLQAGQTSLSVTSFDLLGQLNSASISKLSTMMHMFEHRNRLELTFTNENRRCVE